MLEIRRESGGGDGPLRNLRRDLDIRDYLDATAEAARRTRVVTLAMAVASLLTLVAWMNSRENAWMAERLADFNRFDDPYVFERIGPPNVPPGTAEFRKARYEQFYAALAQKYVDNSFYVRVPFFGFAIDANDLGTIGGLGFVLILALYYFCLSREAFNLRISLEHVRGTPRLLQFYTLLSMRQVLTVPQMPGVTRSPGVKHLPKLLWAAPFVVHLIVTGSQFNASGKSANLRFANTDIGMFWNVSFLMAILILSIVVFWKMDRIDEIWDDFWSAVQNKPNLVPRRDPPTSWRLRIRSQLQSIAGTPPVRVVAFVGGVCLFGVGLVMMIYQAASAAPRLGSPAVSLLVLIGGVAVCWAARRADREARLLALLVLAAAFVLITG